MNYFFFVLAVILLVVGHVIRVIRWKQFLQTYEQPRFEQLLFSLTVGYSVSFFVPFRIGDIARAIISGRKLKNGIPFSLATILMEHFVDVPVVFLIFYAIWRTLQSDGIVLGSMILYGALVAGMLVLGTIVLWFGKYIKNIARFFCSIFNDRIKNWLLFFLWGLIVSFKDVIRKIKKIKLIFYTVFMWFVYILSYIFLTITIVSIDPDVDFVQIFSQLFSQGGFNLINSLDLSYNVPVFSGLYSTVTVVYITISLVLLLGISFLWRYTKSNEKFLGSKNSESIQSLLPYINQQERNRFFEEYFSLGNSSNLKRYIRANKDVQIIQDFTGGSNATTILCTDGEQTFFRKYAFGLDSDKLFAQVQWLKAHKGLLPLPVILKTQREDGTCIYDMEYNAKAIGLFNYMHCSSGESTWHLLEMALDTLRLGLHSRNTRPVRKETIKKYIEEKVISNLEKIESAKELKSLLDYDKLIINGESYLNLKHLKKWLSKKNLMEMFESDVVCSIHGDLTVENIIITESNPEQPFYIIDPNTGNILDSPALDYAKLLQSLHGAYEFLTLTENVQVKRNEISYIAFRSSHYSNIYNAFHDYLETNFSPKQVQSIYFHEIVHWIRLIPYRIKHDSARVPVFYSGFIKIFNEIIEWYKESLESAPTPDSVDGNERLDIEK